MEFLYNRVGERIAKRDQNGTVHEYEYDNLGRLLHDRATTLAADISTTIRRISTVYDAVGNVGSITSYDSSDNVVNEMKYEYDTNGLLGGIYTMRKMTISIPKCQQVENCPLRFVRSC